MTDRKMISVKMNVAAWNIRRAAHIARRPTDENIIEALRLLRNAKQCAPAFTAHACAVVPSLRDVYRYT